MQRGCQAKCAPPGHCKTKQTRNISILDWKDQDQNPKEREQVAPRYSLTIAISWGSHLFLFLLSTTFCHCIPFSPFLLVQSKIQIYQCTISTAYVPNSHLYNCLSRQIRSKARTITYSILTTNLLDLPSYHHTSLPNYT